MSTLQKCRIRIFLKKNLPVAGPSAHIARVMSSFYRPVMVHHRKQCVSAIVSHQLLARFLDYSFSSFSVQGPKPALKELMYCLWLRLKIWVCLAMVSPQKISKTFETVSGILIPELLERVLGSSAECLIGLCVVAVVSKRGSERRHVQILREWHECSDLLVQFRTVLESLQKPVSG